MIDTRIAAYPSRSVCVDGKTLAFREAGKGDALVLLHGIGSGSASWLFQLEELGKQYRVVAWDAPGYGDSDCFSIQKPHPEHYARVLSVLLNALRITKFVLIGQSLGALMAASYARLFPGLARMVLISPAAGYNGDLGRVAERFRTLDELGPEGLAEKRAAGMLSPNPPPIALELVRWNYRRIRPEGYRQASYCLANGNIRADAPFFGARVLVACGSADTVTPEAGCRDIAKAFPSAEYRSLAGLGHASQAEGPALVNAMIREFAHE